ncbi:MAG TPA: hypothetical protein VK784_17935 [Pseudonocardiaceae bacterium]|jgi:hypothetical protein|nr:hypothetical protein [Pseudonocardiaceae bacterium]
MAEHLELPRPGRLLRTVVWNLTESVGLPGVGYIVGQELAGRNAAMIAAAAILWLVAIVRKIVTGTVPGLVTISALVMTVQAVVVVSTGNVFFFLLQFPLANLVMCVLFARTAPTRKPLIAQLAAEVVALRQPSTHHPALHRFFQGATWLWAGLFFLTTVGLSVMMLTEPLTLFLVLYTAVTVGGVVVGAGLCALWFYRVIRKTGLRIRFAAV